MSRRFRVAVIGAGIGAAHVEAYRANAPGYEVAAVCALDAARAGEVAATVPGAAAETSYDKVLARADIDLVDICLPPNLHFDAVAAALAAGKHVLCEKPLVGSLAEVERLMQAAEAAGRAVVPVFQYRYGNGLSRLRRLIAAGVTGRPLVAASETHWNRLPGYYDVRWRGRKATELGGAIVGHAIHAHDLITFTLGPVRRVFAKVATRVNAVETEDCAAVCLEMASGALVTSSVTLGAAEEQSRLRFCFAELTAENPGVPPYRPAEGAWRFIARGARRQEEIDAALAGFVPGRESFAGLIEALHPALAGTAPWPLTLQDAYRSLELASAIYYSSATDTAVELPLAPDHPVRAGWGPWLA
ncbi:MAG TPA: Gfo/Idh/MocA family oxidoreductase [Xanthobacteraceae bacterium]|nr:Gfo/Idh/MocA family oxidoreductase [Xanthobacteraceae bacterium]